VELHRVGLDGAEALHPGDELVEEDVAPHLAVGDDVDARLLHFADGKPGGVVLRLRQPLLVDPPELARRHSGREPTGQLFAID